MMNDQSEKVTRNQIPATRKNNSRFPSLSLSPKNGRIRPSTKRDRVRVRVIWYLVTGFWFLLAANAFASVSRVEFYRDGTKIGEDTSAPYSLSVDTTSTTTGSHTFSAKAYDSAGNVTTSSINTVNVSNNVVDPGPWAKGFGGVGDDSGSTVATDSTGNIIVAGYFSGTAQFDDVSLNSAGGNDIFLAKYSSSGARVWLKKFGGSGRDRATSVTVDKNNDIVVVGYFSGQVDFSEGISPPVTSKGVLDIFVAKYSSTGTYVWSKGLGAGYDDVCYGVAADTNNNVLITGGFQGTVYFSETSSLTANLGYDFFLAKYSGSGAHLWSRRALSNGSEFGFGVGSDANGDVWTSGSFTAKLDFGGGTLTTAGQEDIFLAKFSGTDGSYRWQNSFGSTSSDVSSGVAIDSNNNVVMAGYFGGTVNFGGGPISTPIGATDAFVAKYTSSGIWVWSKRLGAPIFALGYAVSVDESGNVFTTGFFQNTANVDGQLVTSVGGSDVFVSKYSSDGTHVTTQRFGGATADVGYGMDADPNGKIVVTGAFQGTADFGGVTLTSPSVSDSNIFLMRMEA